MPMSPALGMEKSRVETSMALALERSVAAGRADPAAAGERLRFPKSAKAHGVAKSTQKCSDKVEGGDLRHRRGGQNTQIYGVSKLFGPPRRFGWDGGPRGAGKGRATGAGSRQPGLSGLPAVARGGAITSQAAVRCATKMTAETSPLPKSGFWDFALHRELGPKAGAKFFVRTISRLHRRRALKNSSLLICGETLRKHHAGDSGELLSRAGDSILR